MNCPQCMNMKVRCTDSRPVEGTVRRRRECQVCGARWTTYEMTFHEATGFYEHNSPLEQPLSLMRDLAALSAPHRTAAYKVIRGLLALDKINEVNGKDAA